MSMNRKSQESSAKTLRDLASIQENRFCFDCGQRGPTYINISIGSFVCTGCGGALRKYNQRVKSMSVSNFSSQEIDFIKHRGNKACGKIYLALCDGKEPDERNSDFDDYLRLKYQVQKWYRTPDPAVEEEAFRENEEALSRASQNSTTKVNHISANAAAGLIILNNRSLPTSLCKPPNSTQASSEITSDKTGTSNPCPVSTPNISQQQSSLFSSTTENDCVFPDPFAEFVAARPAIAASQTANQSSLSAQLAYNTSTTSPLQNIQSVQLSSSSPVYKLPTFPPPPSASTVFSASRPSVSSSLFVNLGCDTASAPVDKYAALAELDRMGKIEDCNKFSKPSVTGTFPSVALTPLGTQQGNPFGSSTYNPFHSQHLSSNNPFAVMNESATVAMQSNTTLAPKAANIPTSLGQNSFNPFVMH
ncbi:Arf GTPase activating protein [Echinococcus multilocularis]|uniref:Arf GTPase activating protein n=1 Tax=Echinococcus multilocularis TaxID=6211 RepID=A0A068Y0W9_ECHMU|nr:Arf GTPase activating protein [Echinococcus multilocularis]